MKQMKTFFYSFGKNVFAETNKWRKPIGMVFKLFASLSSDVLTITTDGSYVITGTNLAGRIFKVYNVQS